MQTLRNKKEIAPDKHTKSSIPRHDSQSVRRVVCLMSSGVLSSSHCHNLALFKLPGVPRACRPAVDVRLRTLFGITRASCFRLAKKHSLSPISISKVKGGLLPNEGPFSASLWGEVELVIQSPLRALKPREHAERRDKVGGKRTERRT